MLTINKSNCNVFLLLCYNEEFPIVITAITCVLSPQNCTDVIAGGGRQHDGRLAAGAAVLQPESWRLEKEAPGARQHHG